MTRRDICIARRLKALRGAIPKNTYQTIIGQIAAGQSDAAERGIIRLEERMRRKNFEQEREAQGGRREKFDQP